MFMFSRPISLFLVSLRSERHTQSGFKNVGHTRWQSIKRRRRILFTFVRVTFILRARVVLKVSR